MATTPAKIDPTENFHFRGHPRIFPERGPRSAHGSNQPRTTDRTNQNEPELPAQENNHVHHTCTDSWRPQEQSRSGGVASRDYFHAAEDKETRSLLAKGVWTIETPTHPVKTIKGAFVFQTKELPGGYVEKVKARYVGKGYCQTKGLHYHSSFAPVAFAVAVRIIFMIACNNGWPLHHLNVSVAFLTPPD
jgi:hypothetical protein